MAKKREQAVETPPPPAMQGLPPQSGEELNEDDTAVIEPVAFSVMLKYQHPLSSYGRCSYRFNKETAVEIERAALTDAQIITLFADPWLEVMPLVEETGETGGT